MPVCAHVVNVNGVDLLALDAAQTNFATCTYVVETGPEVANSLAAMSPADGGLFAAGVISCWIVAFGIRSIATVIKGPQNE